MADITQAAKWLLNGHAVAREREKFKLVPNTAPFRFTYTVECADGGDHVLDAYDLLATDWKKATSI
jgi:hypothetical protein